MIILVRHSDDESDGCSQEHDCQLARRGRNLAYKVGKKLIERYGMPDLILVSPFRRTIQTMRYMLYNVNTDHIKMIEDRRLSRWFTSKQKKRPIVDKVTLEKDIPINETYREFKERIVDFANEVDTLDSKDKVIWVITHVVVYKRLCNLYGLKINHHVPFMEYQVFEYCDNCDEYHNM